MNRTVLVLLTFITSAAALGSISIIMWDLFLRERWRMRRRFVQEFYLGETAERKGKGRLFKDLSQLAQEVQISSRAQPSFRRRWEIMLAQTDSGLTFPNLMVICLITGAVLSGLGFFLTFHWLGALPGVIGLFVPAYVIYFIHQKRLSKLLQQFPEALDMMVRFLAAGQTLNRAMLTIAREGEDPIRTEFNHCVEQQSLGLPSDITLRELAERTGLLEFKILVLALLVQQQTGGNLTALLEKLSHVVRGRIRLKGHMRAITAEGRMQALLLIVLPPFMFLVMFVVNREYIVVILDYPYLLAATLGSMGIGALWIRKIVNIDF